MLTTVLTCSPGRINQKMKKKKHNQAYIGLTLWPVTDNDKCATVPGVAFVFLLHFIVNLFVFTCCLLWTKSGGFPPLKSYADLGFPWSDTPPPSRLMLIPESSRIRLLPCCLESRPAWLLRNEHFKSAPVSDLMWAVRLCCASFCSGFCSWDLVSLVSEASSCELHLV